MSVPYRDEESGLMLLDPIEYLPSPGGGFAVPDEERARWDRKPYSTETTGPKPRSLDTLRTDLATWMFVDDPLNAQLEREYLRNALLVTHMVADVVRACEAGRLMRPAGTLANRLKALASR